MVFQAVSRIIGKDMHITTTPGCGKYRQIRLPPNPLGKKPISKFWRTDKVHIPGRGSLAHLLKEEYRPSPRRRPLRETLAATRLVRSSARLEPSLLPLTLSFQVLVFVTVFVVCFWDPGGSGVAFICASLPLSVLAHCFQWPCFLVPGFLGWSCFMPLSNTDGVRLRLEEENPGCRTLVQEGALRRACAALLQDTHHSDGRRRC